MRDVGGRLEIRGLGGSVESDGHVFSVSGINIRVWHIFCVLKLW